MKRLTKYDGARYTLVDGQYEAAVRKLAAYENVAPDPLEMAHLVRTAQDVVANDMFSPAQVERVDEFGKDVAASTAAATLREVIAYLRVKGYGDAADFLEDNNENG